MAYASTRRNGRDHDVWIMDPAEPDEARIALELLAADRGDGLPMAHVTMASGGYSSPNRIGETLDLSVGFSDIAPIGTSLDADTPLAVVHATDDASAARAGEQYRAACSIAADVPVSRPVVLETIGAD